jgi:hypothetical protein
MDNNINKSKHQGIAVVVALIAAASMLYLGAVAATSITPAYAGEDDDAADGTEKNIDELIIINKDEQPLTQEGLLKLLTEQQTKSEPLEQQPMGQVDESSGVGTDGFSAPSLP